MNRGLSSEADSRPLRTIRAETMAVGLFILAMLQGSTMTLSFALTYSPALESVVRLLWFIMYGWAVAGLLVGYGFNWIGWLFRYRLPLMVILIGMLLSFTWSIDPGLTIERSVHMLGTTLIGIFIGMALPLQRILSLSWKLFLLMLLASIIAALFAPELGIEQYTAGQTAWKGVMSSKNHLGFWAAIAVLLFLDRLYHEEQFSQRILLGMGVLIALINLVFSLSATSLLAMLVAMVMSTYLFLARRFHLGLFAVILLGMLAVGVSVVLFMQIDTTELLGRSSDMTGRGQIWEQSWAVVQQNPLGGLGYGTLWYPNEDSLWVQESLYKLSWVAHHAHNGILQIATELGLPLTGMMILYLLVQMIESVHLQFSRQEPGLLFVVAFLIAFLIGNYSESRLLVTRELFWIYFLLLPMAVLQLPAHQSWRSKLSKADNGHRLHPAAPRQRGSRPQHPPTPTSGLIAPPPMWGDEPQRDALPLVVPGLIADAEIVADDTPAKAAMRQDAPIDSDDHRKRLEQALREVAALRARRRAEREQLAKSSPRNKT